MKDDINAKIELGLPLTAEQQALYSLLNTSFEKALEIYINM